MVGNPHGGTLINRIEQLNGKTIKSLTKVNLTPVQLSDLDCIAKGVYSPLEGFMNKDDYSSVLNRMRLKNGVVWTIPITLSISKEQSKNIRVGEEVALMHEGLAYGWMEVEDIYDVDLLEEATRIYGTTDLEHPGVARLLGGPSRNIGGKITMFREVPTLFPDHARTPVETRKLFEDRGWKTIVGFQTRNPIHRAHEYIQKTALEHVDGLFIHPLVGETKPDDIPADIRMACYNVLIENYYPKDRVLLGTLSCSMRYAGPREAVFHALVRKNYGCTHFIVGRDHAGVGDYYGTYDAQHIFEAFSPEELGIVPVCMEHSFYCRICEQMASSKTCPHDRTAHIHLSGTMVRNMLKKGDVPPKYFSRPEVIEQLLQYYGRPKDEK
ncbi:sulfate adenylyltransferase [Pseudalkalibacillus sp. SCS-8]|uniref:sulfate adenylyltransferase n=1 Tax=Pseudalkalibacillus nanhaiensis TaxID=3115291 RepID=UPI0032DB43CC